jgi:hypothetical protein
MLKGWLHVENKTNTEREKKQRHAPRRHILAVERRGENFIALVHSICRQLNSPAQTSNKEPPFFSFSYRPSYVGLSPGLDFTVPHKWYGKVRLPPQGLLLVYSLPTNQPHFAIVRQVD